MKTEAVIFDLFGTLLYLAQETRPYARLFQDLGIHTPEEVRQARRIAITEHFEELSSLVERIKPGSHIDTQSYQQEIERERQSATLYQETIPVLDKLQRSGLKVGLISNLASPYKKPFFDLGLQQYFQEIIFSCDIGLQKPDQKIYRIMIRKLDVDPANVLMTGDKVHADVDGPRSIKIKAVHLDRKHSSEHSIMNLEGIFQYLLQ